MPLSHWIDAFRSPVHPENRANLARLWAELPEGLRTADQLYGRQWEGCAATMGVMPRCDFGCTACYLGPEANAIQPISMAEAVDQLRLIRSQVGRWGNVQLTDGEVVLRPESEVVELVRAAHRLELIPMLMTHGDAFRRDPAFLERLALAGLSEVSFHVDTTQRGRSGLGTRERESELHSVRAELAEVVRRVRRRTGLDLRVASTVTVGSSNLEGVADVVRFALANNDVYRILSFQPVADVGRTRGESGVTREALWREISSGLGEDMENPGSAWSSNQVFGHPACTHVVMGSVWHRSGAEPRFVPLRDPTDRTSEEHVREFFRRFGGVSFRSDSRSLAWVRAAGLLASAPLFWLTRAPRWARAFLARADGSARGPARGSTGRALLGLATRRARLGALAIVSHHFMDRSTLESEEGCEREAACVFRVPHRGELVSMCRINAGGLREQFYRERQGALTEAR